MSTGLAGGPGIRSPFSPGATVERRVLAMLAQLAGRAINRAGLGQIEARVSLFDGSRGGGTVAARSRG